MDSTMMSTNSIRAKISYSKIRNLEALSKNSLLKTKLSLNNTHIGVSSNNNSKVYREQ